MASNGTDPATGHPIFLATEAPDLGVDETLVAQYAGDVGNYIRRTDLAALNAYAHKRRGLMGFALDTGIPYVHNGSGWDELLRVGEMPWTALAAASGWTANTGGGSPQVSLTGGTA